MTRVAAARLRCNSVHRRNNMPGEALALREDRPEGEPVMKKLTIALAAAAVLGMAVPASAPVGVYVDDGYRGWWGGPAYGYRHWGGPRAEIIVAPRYRHHYYGYRAYGYRGWWGGY